MTPFFQKKVDRRSRSAMVDFLQGHYRYNTMSSWNRLTSYANNIKIHRLGLLSEQEDKAYKMLDTDFWEEIRGPIDDFTYDQGHRYTLCSNGRSGGYLVLHESHLELTGHLSYCPTCGQRNFKKVPPVTYQDENEEVIAREILRSQNSWLPGVYLGQPAIQTLTISDDKKLLLINRLKTELKDSSASDACGVCGNPRRNFSVPPSRLMVASRSIDQCEDFDAEDWSMESLRDRVDLVFAFDAACDAIRSNFIALLDDYDVVEITEHRPVQVKKLVAHAA
ncbi:MAG: cysteine protease [Methyloglobulus sp.]|nr:cysteine protease [Methyloglobulus sp.]